MGLKRVLRSTFERICKHTELRGRHLTHGDELPGLNGRKSESNSAVSCRVCTTRIESRAMSWSYACQSRKRRRRSREHRTKKDKDPSHHLIRFPKVRKTMEKKILVNMQNICLKGSMNTDKIRVARLQSYNVSNQKFFRETSGSTLHGKVGYVTMEGFFTLVTLLSSSIHPFRGRSSLVRSSSNPRRQ